jgi:hypothetical protein
MKKVFSWTLNVSLVFIAASALTYTIHYLIFRDTHHIFIYMIGDFGFLFIDVLLVVLFVERILSRRDKRNMMNKLNMVIGTFFSEFGLEFLKRFSIFVNNSEQLAKKMIITSQWGNKEFKNAISAAGDFSYDIKIDKDKLCELRDFLISKRTFLLQLLENPNLLEHDSFTDLLWAVFHLTEELAFREDKLKELPKADYNHLALDLQRAYSQITSSWVAYMGHMKDSYPFLFSLAARINPMDPNASPIISV